MKKSLSTFILALLATVSAWAQTFTVDNLKYEVTDGTAKTVKLTGYGTEPEGKLEIPATVSYNGTDYGVTGIGYLAFNRCSKLTEVTIPNSVDNLETYAFSFCSGLTKVTLLGSVTNIGSSVFQSNTSLKQVTIGDGVTQIGENMFAFCTSLTEVTIPNSVTSIGNQAFQECNALTTVTIGENVTRIGECAFWKCSITEVVIPDNVIDIENAAFQGASALTRVTLGKSVRNIGENAFNGCLDIAEMTVMAEVPPTLGLGALTGISYTTPIYVPAKAFNDYKAADTWKDFSKLQKISFTVDNLKYSVTDESSKTVEVVGYEAEPEGKLQIPATVNIDGADYSVTQIGNNAFYKCHEITELIIGKNVSSIGEYGFYDCRNIEKMTVHAITPPTVGTYGLASIPTNIPVIYVYKEAMEAYKGANEWKQFSNWKEITFTVDNLKYNITDESNKTVEVIGYVTVPEGKVEIPATVSINGAEYKVTGIYNKAFWVCDKITEVILGENVTEIGNDAFAECSQITKVTFGENVTRIGERAFWKCAAITEVVIPDNVTDIENAAFQGASALTRITIGKSVSSIGDDAFNGCPNIAEMTVKAEVPPTLGLGALTGIDVSIPVYVPIKAVNDYKAADIWKQFGNLQAISFTVDNLKYNITDESNKTVEVIGYVTVPEGKVEIPATVSINGAEYKVTGIYNKAFWVCDKITEVILGENVTEIGNDAFAECSQITKVTFGENVTRIGERAFWKCAAITEVVIPDNVTDIENAAFQGASALTRVTLGKSVRNIGENAFNGCLDIAEMTVMAEVPPTLGLGALTGISYTTPIYVPAKAFNDYKAADTWKDFSKLQKISFTVDNLKYSVTDESSKTVEVVGYEAEPEGKLQIPATVNINGIEYKITGIDNNAFTECNKITEVIIGENVTRIGDNAFNGCPNIAEMTIMATVPPTVGVDAFTASLSSMVYVPVKAVNDYKMADTWKNFSKVKAIPFIVGNLKYSITDADSKTVELIGYETEPEGKLEIPATVNYNGTDYIVTEIYNNVFNRCNKLTEVIIGKNVTSIGNNAFNQCDKLTEVIIGENVTRIGEFAFWNCSAITEIEIPNNVTDIEKAAFQKASALTRVTIGKSVSSIGDNAFNGCPNIVEMTVMAVEPPTVGEDAFTEISLSTSVYVPAEAFDNYKAANVWKEIKNLKAIPFTVDNLKYSVTDTRYKIVELIGYEAKPEGKLEIPATVNHNDTDYSVTRIGDKAFYGCDMITEMNVKAIVPPAVGKDAFENVSLDIPVYVRAEALGSYKITEGWRDFTNLKSIPFTVDNLKYSITDVSNKTVELIGYETKPEGKLEIPATVNYNGADYSVTRIGDKAFYGCDMITEMNVKATVPPAVGKEAFENVDRDIPVYVPAEAMDSYKAAEGWRDFTNLKNPSTTGLHRSTLPESISVNNGTLHNPQGLAVSIYDLKGRLVYSGKGTSISLPAGMYVVRCAGANSKVIF